MLKDRVVHTQHMWCVTGPTIDLLKALHRCKLSCFELRHTSLTQTSFDNYETEKPDLNDIKWAQDTVGYSPAANGGHL